MKGILRKIIIFVATLFASFISAVPFVNFYNYFYPPKIGGVSFFTIPESAADYIMGLPLSYTFLLSLLFTAFGGAKKYWWIGILLIPAVIFEVYFDLSRIYFPIALGLLGWLLGFVARKILV